MTEALGQYVDLYGTWSSHLSLYKRYSQIARELIQNSDDSGATSVSISITPDALILHNNSEISRCSAPTAYLSPQCARDHGNPNRYCDFHAIRGSNTQNKAANENATGRFGIGLVSTFRLTDKLTFSTSQFDLVWNPELQIWSYSTAENASSTEELRLFQSTNRAFSGTKVILEFSKPPRSETRISLKQPAIEEKDIPNIAEEFRSAGFESLYFTRNLK